MNFFIRTATDPDLGSELGIVRHKEASELFCSKLQELGDINGVHDHDHERAPELAHRAAFDTALELGVELVIEEEENDITFTFNFVPTIVITEVEPTPPGKCADCPFEVAECEGCEFDVEPVEKDDPDRYVEAGYTPPIECAGCPGLLDDGSGHNLPDCVGCETLPVEFRAAAEATPDPDVVATAKTGWKTPAEIADEHNPDPRLAKQAQATDIGRAIAYLLKLELQHQGDEYYTYETAPGYGTKNYAGLARFVGRIFSDHKFLARLIEDAKDLPGEGHKEEV